MKAQILLAASVIALASHPAMAQTTENDGSQDPAADVQGDDNVIVVSGFRESLELARNQKKNAPAIQDVLAAEDIGALPTLSIAESLERLPGLAADRDRGNSSQISIRGLGPLFGLTLFNVVSSLRLLRTEMLDLTSFRPR